MQVQGPEEFEIAREILHQSDRASAIVATAYLEDKLTALLEKSLTRDSATETVFKMLTDQSGPLGSLMTKARLAYLMGMFGPLTLADFRGVSIIRNRFAHMSAVRDFNDDKIRNRCENLTIYERTWSDHPNWPALAIPRPFNQERARKMFIESISIISNFLVGIRDGIASRPG